MPDPKSSSSPTMKRIFRVLGKAQAAFLLTALYFLFWVPVGILTRVFADWLCVRAPRQSNWRPRAARVNNPASVTDPF